MKTLLVVDMQKGFLKNENYLNLSNKIQSLINNNNYDKILFTKFKNDILKNSFYQEKLGWHKLTTQEEQDFSINIPKNSIILEKYGYGITPNDIDKLKSLNITEIDICGVQAEACVYAIALDLWDNGIYPNILIDYILGDMDMRNIFSQQFGKNKKPLC